MSNHCLNSDDRHNVQPEGLKKPTYLPFDDLYCPGHEARLKAGIISCSRAELNWQGWFRLIAIKKRAEFRLKKRDLFTDIHPDMDV